MATVHLVALPHLEVIRENSWCAYTQKVLKLANMLTDAGHDVYVYGGERCDARCKESVCVVTKEQREKWFSHYNWERDVFHGWDASEEWWRRMNISASFEILNRALPDDFVGIIAGTCQMMLADLKLTPIEWGIGYEGVLKGTHKCFESYAWMHHVAGRERDSDIHFYDTVIPNSFELEDFPEGKGGGDFVFLGRLIRRKGPQIAGETCQRIGARLTLAGQGLDRNSSYQDRIQGQDGTIIEGNVRHVGLVDAKRRARLLGSAVATFVPTTYLEPFGGVAIESMLCGTPAITTDHGAFTEYVIDGFNGFRCRTLADFVKAAEIAPTLDRQAIRQWAAERYSTDVVKHRYDDWLSRLSTLRADGWYS